MIEKVLKMELKLVCVPPKNAISNGNDNEDGIRDLETVEHDKVVLDQDDEANDYQDCYNVQQNEVGQDQDCDNTQEHVQKDDMGRNEDQENMQKDVEKSECKDFMDYFKAIWYPRIGSWITALKTMPIASLESSTALELYHNQLKIRFLNNDIYKRADWLVNKLSTKLHSYFWLDEYEGKDDFSRYRKDEWASDFTSWRKSRTIPNTDVITEGERVKVVDRVIQYQREKASVLPSISLIQYNQCLINMLKCPPANSLIRDDAVSLAVWINEQLSAQFAKSAQNGVSRGRVEMENSYTQMEIDLE
ncbi:hypothetical protein Tco_1402373 [Tanacetum coccineum]